MKIIGLILESYGKYMKVRTPDSEIIVKSDRKPPKEGSKIEIKDFGYGDLKATIIVKRDDMVDHLPDLRLLEVSEKLSRLIPGQLQEWSKDITARIALVLEEVSKKTDIDREFLKNFESYLANSDEFFEFYLNILSGGYGLLYRNGIFVFLNRKNSRFEVFTKDNKIKGLVTEKAVTLYFQRIPADVRELELNLKRHFGFVNIKLESLDGGVYV
uniref:Uncharacterized protein n=1 Tax=Fervidobacterium thailandense TaxID=1008305 RepID=A0A7C5VL38_9BACT